MRNWVTRAVQRNYGFERVERLDGNIGYIDLRLVFSPEFAGDTAAAAMQLVTNTNALILDLRHNGGGVPAMVALLCSYMFEAEPPVHLNDFVARNGERRASWTVREVAGPRYLNKGVYVLTGPETISGGEELAYILKHLGRATIIGEHTAGAAHVAPPFRVDDHFQAFISVGRPVHPITGTNWEGIGVEPDIHVPANDALAAALNN